MKPIDPVAHDDPAASSESARECRAADAPHRDAAQTSAMADTAFDLASSEARASDAPRRHVPGVALLFEGGGMRASYTSGSVVALLEEGIEFDFVCGLSAGASNTVNFLSHDVARTKKSFVDFAADPHFGGWRTFVRGKGMFSAHWIYEEAGLPDGVLPFHMDAFLANPARCAIQAFDRDSGESVVWTKDDMPTLEALMQRVRASSTLPVAMPPIRIDGRTYYDGGLGRGGGIALDVALEAGYERIFAVLTRPQGYRKPEPDARARATADLFRRYPHVRDALLTRHVRYNQTLDRLEEMAREGKALIVYANKMAVENSTMDVPTLERSFADGYAQARSELPRWRDWLGI